MSCLALPITEGQAALRRCQLISRATFPGNPRDRLELLPARLEEALPRAEVVQQQPLARRPPRKVVEDRARHGLVPPPAVELDREAVRLVADALERERCRGRAPSGCGRPGMKTSSIRLASDTTITASRTPASMFFAAFSRSVNTPVDSITTSAPASPHCAAAGSRSPKTLISRANEDEARRPARAPTSRVVPIFADRTRRQS